MADRPNGLLTDLLRQVSRSFYLTLRVLPNSLRPQIGLAYLLARTTDTIADTNLVPLERRLQALQALRDRILGRSDSPLSLGELAQQQGTPAERVLLEQSEAALALLSAFNPDDQQRISQLLDVIVSGQELDLRRFSGASEKQIVALSSDGDLDDYTYRVAGCVGEFWTRMCRAHVFANAALDDAWLLAKAVRFGKGLQLVNILRDLPADLRKGRCYLPGPALSAAGLSAGDLLQPSAEPALRPVYDRHLDLAEAHLSAGWDYTNALPWKHVRVRLACAWPILIGVKTIQRLRRNPVLDPGCRVKITRPQVRQLMVRSILLYSWPSAWRKLPGLPPPGVAERAGKPVAS